jgi:hypothetical protein
MKWKKFEPGDYPLVAPWFVAHGWPVAPALEVLPTMGVLIFSDEDEPLAVGFLYISNSILGFIDWLATNPKLGVSGFKALQFLVEVLCGVAAGSGMKQVMHLSRFKYVKVFERRLGFKKSEDLSVLFRRVG